MQNQSKHEITFDTQSKTALIQFDLFGRFSWKVGFLHNCMFLFFLQFLPGFPQS